VSYGYDELGRRTSMTTAHGTAGYGYDAAGQLTSMTDWAGETSAFDYDVDGQLTSITRPNGVTSAFEYDDALRLTGIDHRRGTTSIDSFDYTLDANGNRTGVTSTAGSERYTLDALGRLRAVTYPDGQVSTYTYDAGGNRLTEATGATTRTYTYDGAGRLTSDGTKSYTYDAAGNVTGAGADQYQWDWAGQMTSASVDGQQTSYEYDGDGLRVGQVDSTGSTEFVWDRESGLPTLVSDGDTGYLQLGRLPFEATTGGSISYFLGDALGSVRAVTAAGGSVTSRQSYDVWGAPRSSLPATFGFAGEQHDTTGLIHLRARQYDPSIGRFLSADRVQPNAPGTQGWNLYGYAAGNPSTLIDPSGHSVLVEYAITGLIAGAVIGAAIGLFACSGSSGFAYMECVVSNAALGGLSGLVGGIVFGLALAALGVSVAAYAIAGGLSGLAGALAGGTTDPQALAIAALIGVITAGLGTWIARTPMGQAARQYLDDLMIRIRGGSTGAGGAAGGAGATGGAGSTSPWSLNQFARGLEIEDMLGGNLPKNFPTIDRFANGVATSIKSIDLTAPTYQNVGRLTSRLNGYIDSAAGFNGATFNGVAITPGQITSRGLDIAIQPGVASAAQTAALNDAIAYGASQGVVVRVVTVP
jgi:RHS repeat-associated protein